MAIFKCPFCKYKYVDKDALMNHMETVHKEEMHNLPPQQIYFNYTNRYALTKEFGRCVETGRMTKFNVITNRYERYADEAARKLARERALANHRRVHGKDTLLGEPDHQDKMLSNRSISGEFTWEDGSKTKYVGSYERKFLEYLSIAGWGNNSTDIMGPAPMVFDYIDKDGRKRFHIPDFYITSLNLIVNIKSSTNKHYRLRDIDNEMIQDKILNEQKEYNYLKLYDNKFEVFDKKVKELSEKLNNKQIK